MTNRSGANTQFHQLSGKRAIVTGASRGIGLRLAIALANSGAKVALLARPSDELTHAAETVGNSAIAIPCDVSSPASIRKAFAECASTLGGVDILVNNAALCLLHKLREATDEDLYREVHTNLIGPAMCMRAVLPLMQSAGGGDIVNISSESVRLPFPFMSMYAATKAGLEMLTTAMRSELRGENVRVSILRAGNVAESTLDRHWDKNKIAEFWETIQKTGHAAFTGKPMSPETIAQAMVCLLTMPREANIDIVEVRAI